MRAGVPGPVRTAAPAASPTPKAQVAYTAFGASDAVGIGASQPCGTTVAAVDCTGTGYVPDLVALLSPAANVSLNDLGISGAVLGPDIAALGDTYGFEGSADACMPRGTSDAIPGDFLTNEVPNLTGKETLITVFAGGNDVLAIANALGCGAGGTTTSSQTAFVTTWITNFGNDLVTLANDIHAKSPNAKVVIANLPNFALIPLGQEYDMTTRQALAALTVGIDQNVIDKAPALGYPVVDLLCNPNSYAASNFSSDGFHPDDAGYTLFAQQYDAQIAAATPAAPNPACSYASTYAKMRTPMTHPLAVPASVR